MYSDTIHYKCNRWCGDDVADEADEAYEVWDKLCHVFCVVGGK